ncbi:MAG: hypothetical protein ACO1TE_29185 [Prosthecobacter sp.]
MDATDTKNKLARSISAEQLQEFLAELAQTPGVDGPMIREKALEKFDLKIGNDSANQFRKEILGGYLERMRKRKELSAAIAEVRQDDSGRTLADAANEELQQQVFEFLAGEPLRLDDDEDLERAEALARIIKSGRSEDRRMIDQLNKRLKDLEEREKETKADLKDNTLSADQRAARMRARFGV